MDHSVALYRDVLGAYHFSGRPLVRLNLHLGPLERRLLDLHEHNHWALVNTTVFGTEQLALGYALQHTTDQSVSGRLKACLLIMADLSRHVYEGCAVCDEVYTLSLAGVDAPPDWFSLLNDATYKQAQSLYEDWLSQLPYGDGLKNSLAFNAAELCLNSTPPVLESADVVTPEGIREALASASPDFLLTQLSAALTKHSGEFREGFEQMAVEHCLSVAGLDMGALREDSALPTTDPIFVGRMSYVTYQALMSFAREHGVRVANLDAREVDVLREDRWQRWVARLPKHAGAWPIPIWPTAPSEADLRSAQDYFGTVQTWPTLPPRDATEDLWVDGWTAIETAFSRLGTAEPRVYVAIYGAENPPAAAEGTGGSGFLSIARAIFAQRNDFVWTFGRARYRLPYRDGELGARLRECVAFNPTLAVPWRQFDTARGCVRGAEPLTSTEVVVGVLTEVHSVEGWIQASTDVLDKRWRVSLHVVSVGPTELKVAVGICERDSQTWFFYSPLTEAAFRVLDKHAVQLEEMGCTILRSLDEAGTSQRFNARLFLICEQFCVNGF